MTAGQEELTLQWDDALAGGHEVRRHARGRNRSARRREGRGLALFAAALVVVTLATVFANADSGRRPDRGNPHVAPPLIHPFADTTAPTPTPSVSASLAQPPSPTAAPTNRASFPPQLGTVPKTTPAPPTTTAPGPPIFTPIGIEAEASANLLSGGAAVVACGPCAGGHRVGYIEGAAHLVVLASLPISGMRTIRVTYETDGLRQLKIKANNVDVDVRSVDGAGWEEPHVFQFSATLSVGPVQLMFYNDVLPAPDIDRVVIS